MGSQGTVDGLGLSASFDHPCGIAINQANGCLYIAEYNTHKIRKITPQGIFCFNEKWQLLKYQTGVVSTVGGTTPGFADGNVNEAQFFCPRGLAVDDSTGDIYVADSKNHRIRKISDGNHFTEFFFQLTYATFPI